MVDSLNSTLSSDSQDKLALQIAVAALARLVVNTSRRFLYPFASAFSRGLGVPLPAVTSLIALNQFAGLFSPVFGPASDRLGYRLMMLVGLTLLSVGMFVAGFFPVYGLVAVGIFLAGLAKGMYDPALQAYVGERVTFKRRGLFIGLIEMSWAGAALVGIPVMGLLINSLGWRTPFFVLGGLALIFVAVVALVIPAGAQPSTAKLQTANFLTSWQKLRASRVALAALLYGLFVSMANDVIFVVYGAWLEKDFGLGLVALGWATTVIGVAELSGETLTATLSDRLGLKRAVLVGATLSTLSYALLPMIGQSLGLALAGLFITFITFEFTIVTSFSLLTELLPDARATLLASFQAVAGLGRMGGALLGGVLWLWGGILLAGSIAALLSAVGLLAFVWGLRYWTRAEGEA